MVNGFQFNRMLKLRFHRGVATIEFSLLIIPLLLMLFGVTEYGRAIYQYNTLVKSVRDATRYLSTLNAGNGWPEAKCLAVYGNTACSGSPLAPGLTTGMVSICDASVSSCQATHLSQETGTGTINLVTVTISGYQFHSLFNFPIGDVTAGAPDITYHPIHNTMRQVS
jgi:Flp pilus assembly protein TadG